jgi:kynurenine formamidase
MSTEGLQFYELSHKLGHNMVQWPSPFATPFQVNRLNYHAMHDFYAVEYDGIMHRGTHMDTAAHVTANTPYMDAFEPWRFFGTGVAVSIPKGKWGVITPEDLEKADPEIQPNDIVMINTGAHRSFGDNDTYYAYSPGLYSEAAQWLVEKQVKLVGVDVQALDHPLGTRMVEHGPGPTHPHLMDEYREETGRDVMADFPDWEPAHKTMLIAGIPGIENVGGQLDEITGKRCTFMAFPWRMRQEDGCPIRIVAVIDPEQKFRIPAGIPGSEK